MKPLQASTEELVQLLADKLSQTGLFHDEALAMARTWQRGYFQDEGLRVLYVIPRETIDRELPLKVGEFRKKATKVRVVRTFVGRLELLTPDQEAEIELTALDLTRGSPEARDLARAKIAGWGRFAIPYLNRVSTLTDDPDVISTVESELNELAKVR